MAYIGREPTVGNFQVCAAISVVTGQAAYTMQVSSTNVSPETANHVLCSLNGVLQKPGSSFTVSGSTITFASNLATGDVIDFIQILGSTLDLGVPSNDTVGAAQIKDDLISGTTALASEPADTDEFLVSDAGTLKRIDYSLIKPSSSFTKISTTTISNAASVTLDVFTSTYRNYRIIGSGFTPATDAAHLNGEIYQADDTEAGSYYWGAPQWYDDGSDGLTSNVYGGTAEGSFLVFRGTDSGGDKSQANFDMMVYQPQVSDADTTFSIQSAGRRDGTRGAIEISGGFAGGANSFTKIKFSFSSGNIVNGVVTVYGLEN